MMSTAGPGRRTMHDVLAPAAGTPEASPSLCSRRPDLLPARRYSPLLDVSRVVVVLGVVGVHVIADQVDEDGPGAMLVLRTLLATAVPALVLMSGALNLAPAAMRHGSGPFLARRLRRLLPATVAWTAFFVLVMNLWLSPGPTSLRGEIAALL